MNLKQIEKLIVSSYKGGYLDQKKVNRISSLISRSDIKKYINGLKSKELKKNVIVSCPADHQDLEKLRKFFPHKKIIFKKNPSLILGVQIIDNDIVYEFTLKNSLDKILSYIEQNYD